MGGTNSSALVGWGTWDGISVPQLDGETSRPLLFCVNGSYLGISRSGTNVLEMNGNRAIRELILENSNGSVHNGRNVYHAMPTQLAVLVISIHRGALLSPYARQRG